ncbi:GNAT family N-acetyltransferase [Sphingomonas sp. RP10(2022)]|uniref:GNAT family N-acetyltransferase n=1 Tax=Sphingomonas liriopis TaxID=2949094 RepID=A0A9X2HP77_9SPHN|nr:GNAT family N-acetyltransferase [Sphingomonas liriopis]MCP3734618.1 GNAT family N-acetyltransferase [Sphingomonas liriopis]
MATRQVLLRTGDARDVATVDALMGAAFDPRYGEAWTRNQCLGVLAMPGVRLTLALVDDEPAGFAMVRSVADEAELLLLGVGPRFRRRGIATALLRAVIAEAQVTGIADLHLEVRAGNAAVQLYTAQGFAKVGERRAYYRGKTGESFDAHTYRRAV